MSAYTGILWAGLATGSFAVLFNVRGRHIPISAFGGAFGWTIFLFASGSLGSEGVAYFAAAAAIALYAEAASRIFSGLAGTYVACAIITLVPGGGMFTMMSQSLAGDLSGTLEVGFKTLGTAGAIAAGLAIGSAVARLAKRL